MELRQKGEKKLKLNIIHAFGSSASRGLRDCVALNEEDGFRQIIYPVGKFIAIKFLDRQEMSFIKLTENLAKIECMTISPNKKLVAVCERHSTSDNNEEQKYQKRFPTVNIYNIKSNLLKGYQQPSEPKPIVYADSQSESFSCMKFSEDSRFLVLITAPPENKLVYIDVLTRMKEIAQAILPYAVSKVTINPKETHQIVVSGKNIFKMLSIKEGSVYPGESIKRLSSNQNFTDHCWFEDTKICLANDKGELFIIYDGEVKQYINKVFEVPRGLDEDKKKLFQMKNTYITCMHPFSKGLIIASESGYFGIWIKNEDPTNIGNEEEQQKLVYLRGWSSDRHYSACSIDIASQDSLMSVAFKNNDIATFDLTKILPGMAETVDQYKRNNKLLERKHKFDFVYNGFHYGPVTSLDVCVQRPLIATCSSQDNTIRVWNYINFRCEVSRKLSPKSDDVEGLQQVSILNCVALHPSGYYLAAGTVSNLLLFHIMNKSLRTYKEIPTKNVVNAKFSNGGHLLCVAFKKSKQNMFFIQIYDSWTLEPLLKVFSGSKGAHTNMITDILWGPQDEFVTTCAKDGVMYEYKMNQNNEGWIKTDIDYLDHHSKLTSLTYVYDPTDYAGLKLYLVCGGEEKEQNGVIYKDNKGLVQIIKEGIETDSAAQLATLVTSNYRITTLTYIRSLHDYKLILCGMLNGSVNVFPSQFQVHSCLETQQVHDGEVIKIKSSVDGMYAFSSGADGSIFIYQVQEVNEDGHTLPFSLKALDKQGQEEKLNPKVGAVDNQLADVLLVPRLEIDNYLNEQKELKKEYEDLENKMEYQSQEEKKEMEKKINDMKISMNKEIEMWSKRYEDLKTQKTMIEKESSNLLKNMENNHLKATEELENLYEKKLAFENEKYMQQEQTLLEERMKFDKKLKSIESKHDYNITDLKGEFNENFTKAQKVYETTKETANALRQHYEEKLDQQEEEHEAEIRETKDKHKKEIEDLKIKLAQYTSDTDMYKRNSKMVVEEKERMDKEKKEMIIQKERLEQRLSDANNQIETLKQDIKNYEDQLNKKEKKIHEYKYKINDLQKQKHVLSFRTTEMRKSLEPKDAQIDKLKEDLQKLEGEFDGMLKQSQAQNDKMKKMQNQIDTLQKNLKSQCELTSQKDSKLNQLIMDIHNIIHDKDVKIWNSELQRLYQQYVIGEQGVKQSSHDPKGLDELKSQVKHLEKSIHQMNKSSEKIILRREQEVYKKLKENADLIYDLNEMRKLNKELLTDQTDKKSKLDNLQKENANLHQELKQLRNQQGGNIQINNNNRQQQQFQQQQEIELERPQTQDRQRNNTAMIGNYARPQSMKMSQRQGKVIKGPNFDSKTLGTFDKAKMMDMMAEMELSANRLLSQEVQIKEIRNKIRRHVMDKNCQDYNFEEEIIALQNSEQMGMLDESRPISANKRK